MADNRTAGRPTKYSKGLVVAAGFMARQGLINPQIAAELGISGDTLWRWRKKYPEFDQAIKKGKQTPDDKVVDSLFQRATGYSHAEDKIFQFEGHPVVVPTTKHYPPDTTACIFWLKNRRPEEWRDKQEVLNTFDDAAIKLAEAISQI